MHQQQLILTVPYSLKYKAIKICFPSLIVHEQLKEDMCVKTSINQMESCVKPFEKRLLVKIAATYINLFNKLKTNPQNAIIRYQGSPLHSCSTKLNVKEGSGKVKYKLKITER